MARFPHVLAPSQKIETPTRMVFFDTESHVNVEITDEEIKQTVARYDNKRNTTLTPITKPHTPYLCCASFVITKAGTFKDKTTVDEKVYTDADENFISAFWADVDAFTPWKTRTQVFAHNAKYDCQVFQCVPQLVKRGWTVKRFSDSNPFILEFTQKRKNKGKEETRSILILSSTNYYQAPLKDLGKVFNLPKLDFEHGQPFQMEDAITYCKRDVEILQAAMLAFIAFIVKEGLGSFALTVAGQSFKGFKHRFLAQHRIYISTDAREIGTARRAYSGGRTECFSMGEVEGKVYVLDINSMYPSCMSQGKYPVNVKAFYRKMTLKQIKNAIEKGFLVCCDALVTTDKPIFHEKGERLVFPIGNFWTSLSTPEIVEGMKRDAIKEVKNVAVYEAEEIFTSFIDYFYNARLEAKKVDDEIHQYLYKLMMNSLYGKFGQRENVWERIEEADPDEIGTENILDADSGKSYLTKTFGGGIFRKKEGEILEATDSFVAVASHVTAYARMKLLDFLEVAGWENVHYCDTDSLFCTEEGYKRLEAAGRIDQKKLGLLKLEKIVDDFTIYGCKDYTYHILWSEKEKDIGKTTTKIKGISKGSKIIADSGEGNKRFISTQWRGFAEGIRKGNLTTYENRLQIKELKREYRKGIVEGNRVKPYERDVFEVEEPLTHTRHTQFKAVSLLSQQVKEYGYIQIPGKDSRFIREYERISRSTKQKYFRKRGTPLDVWANDHGMSASQLLDELQ